MKKASLALAVLAMLALAGFRGDPRGDYANDVRMTADGVVRFSRSTTGAAASQSDTRSVRFLDVCNGTSSEITVVLYTRSAPDGDSVTTYVPAGASRSFNRMQIDSLRVAGTWAGAAAIFGGSS